MSAETKGVVRLETGENQSSSRIKLLIIESVEEGQRVFIPTLVNQRLEDPISILVDRKIASIETEIKRKRKEMQELSGKKVHGRLLSAKSIRDQRIDIQSEIVREEHLLGALTGERLAPIKLIKSGDAPVDIKVTHFGTKGAHGLSKQVSLDVTELMSSFPKGMSYLVEACRLRSRMLFGRIPEERSEATAEYESFRIRYRHEVSDDDAAKLEPLMGLFTGVLSDN